MIKTFLEFKGTWRNYQRRILDHFNSYNRDKKIHIVAAPGSGKTTLGIELIRRIDQCALILVPSLTIRRQWYDRIVEAFLKEGYQPEDYLSQDLRKPAVITISTYQAVHSAFSKYKGKLIEDDLQEDIDFHDFSLIDTLKKQQVKTLCLDECHHLRSEWWKALEQLKKELPDLYTISLTATPPYDDQIGMWNRYLNMCGDIDEEITVPELVKQDTLCPHQDYVYFNYPTHLETQQLEQYQKNADLLLEQLVNDTVFQDAIKTHRFFNENVDEDILLEKPAYLSAMLIYLKEIGYTTDYFKKLLGYKELESLDVKWLEILLQGFLYDDIESYQVDDSYRKELIKDLKAKGLIEKRQVSLVTNEKVEKLLINSIGKLEGIKQITKHEYQNLGQQLRLLILTDYIRKEYEKNIGDEHFQIQHIGVLPIFEMLRREQFQHLKLGVLCGSMVIIPYSVRNALIDIVGQNKIFFHTVGNLDDYLKVEATGDSHFLTGALSKLFEQGHFQVLIGTKSLLGEGWDSPCVNTLILASFVGSFMLSNQMRGRAIRKDKNNPQKSSHIWHLVCLRPKDNDLQNNYQESEDYQTLKRRMNHFLGLHYQENTIENGIERLSIISEPFSKLKVKQINKQMLTLSKERESLYKRWQDALTVYDQIEVVEENDIKPELISAVLLFDKLRIFVLLVAGFLIGLIAALLIGMSHLVILCIFVIYFGIFFTGILMTFKKIINLKNPLSRLKVFGDGMLKALQQQNLIKSYECKVACYQESVFHCICLKGGTGYEKTLFSKCISEFFEVLDNQRYILYNEKRKGKTDAYFVVPECFSKRKEDAYLFAQMMKKFIGEYETIYTRSEKGRKILLEGRIYALSNKQERCMTKKKVKGALE